MPEHMEHAYYKLYSYVRPESIKDGWSRERILEGFSGHGVPGLSGSCSEIYLERAFTDFGYGLAERLPVARELGESSMMFLVHPTLTEEAMHRMGEIVRDVLARATR